MVKIANFHYAEPQAVLLNYSKQIAISDDETGFKGKCALPYRHEAWDFIMSGGGVFNNLDYSFTAESPKGNSKIRGKTPGSGGHEIRQQISFLKKFIENFNFIKLKPSPEIVVGLGQSFSPDIGRTVIRVLAKTGKQYAIYVRHPEKE